MEMIRVCWCVLVIFFAYANAEMFTSTADIYGNSLLTTEKHLVSVIDQYIEMGTKRLEKLKELAKNYKQDTEDAHQCFTNPLMKYLSIKRMKSSWVNMETEMKNDNAEEFLKIFSHPNHHDMLNFPTEVDLSGAALALLRLQDIYKLNVSEIANGNFAWLPGTDPWKASDCYEIGRMAYFQKDYYHTLMWMEEALSRMHSEDESSPNEADILEHLAFALYQQGNMERALSMTKRIKELEPDHPRAPINIKNYEDSLAKQNYQPGTALPPVHNARRDDPENVDREIYEALCRGDVQKTETEKAALYCYYKRDNPFLKLAPLKADIVNWKPKMIVFRNVLSDAEIDMIKTIATPKLETSMVRNPESGGYERATYRTSKSAWIKDEVNPGIARITKRVAHMTNLGMDTAEEFQIANYGLGGHYLPHCDFVKNGEKNANMVTGNRIATVIFYLSAPEAGGATVFPSLKLTVFPSKNDAVFWHNLYANGMGDMNTMHAACPVLAGTKWISNKWIHEHGQEFRRQCGLDYKDYE